MKKGITIKHQLMSSMLAMLLCCAMLIGATFAWFTDSASTAVNRIQAGSLDLVLESSTDGVTWTEITEGSAPLSFIKAAAGAGQEILWEPGCTYNLPQLRIRNAGNLAFKFRMDFSAVSGDTKLAEVLEVIMNGLDTGITLRDALISTDPDGIIWGVLLPGESTAATTIALHMMESADNEYQGLAVDGVAIFVNATQYTYEYDSFSDQYDASAPYPVSFWDGTSSDTSWFDPADTSFELDTAEELAGLAELIDSGESFDGMTVTLTGNINLKGQPLHLSDFLTGAIFSGTFDGNGNTISGFKSTNNYYDGLFEYVDGATIKNLTLKGEGAGAGLIFYAHDVTVENCTIDLDQTISGSGISGAVVGHAAGNGTFKNITTKGTVNFTRETSSYTNFGSIIGQKYAGAVVTIEGCVNEINITARTTGLGLGGFVGALTYDATGSCTITDCVNNGNITLEAGATGNVGGIVGGNHDCDLLITNCTNNGDITAVSASVLTGGILAMKNNDAADGIVNISDCTNTGHITGGYANQIFTGRYSATKVIITNCTESGSATPL